MSAPETSANPAQTKRIIVAVNPNASFGKNRAVGPAAVEKLRALGHNVTMLLEPDFQQLLLRAHAEIASKPDAFVVIGGDGMVNLGVNMVAGTTVALGLIPTGTGNDMARALGIPYSDVDAAIAALDEALTRPPRTIDAAYASSDDGEGRWFGCMMSAGFDALVNERANNMNRPKGASRYTLALLLELAKLRRIEYTLTMDGVVTTTGASLVCVGNGQSLGGGMKVTPTALLDDGLLDVLVVQPLSRFTFMRIFPSVFSGNHLRDPRVNVHKVKQVRIESPGVVAYADGDRFAPLPIDIEVRPGALRVLAPAVS
ncbi:MAG TPA: diacylglycerol kinase family protein [Pseudolysinimonas sp.]|nr:diacylglycerol kinase family protein [Pseudolysinimonas sp.]